MEQLVPYIGWAVAGLVSIALAALKVLGSKRDGQHTSQTQQFFGPSAADTGQHQVPWITSLESRLTGLDNRLRDVETATTGLRVVVAAVKDEQRELNQNVQVALRQFKQMDDAIDRLNAAVDREYGGGSS